MTRAIETANVIDEERHLPPLGSYSRYANV